MKKENHLERVGAGSIPLREGRLVEGGDELVVEAVPVGLGQVGHEDSQGVDPVRQLLARDDVRALKDHVEDGGADLNTMRSWQSLSV